MSTQSKHFALVSLFALLVFASSCKKKSSTPSGPVVSGVVLDFHPVFAGTEMSFFVTKYAKPDNEIVGVTNWAMIFSKLSLVKNDNSKVLLGDGYLYVDFVNQRSKFTFAEAPAGDYKAISFQLGLDPSINHGDPTTWPADHPLNANTTGLHWGWSSGYVFEALEGNYKVHPDSANRGYSFHVATDSMVRNFEMPLNFSLSSTNRKTATVQLDLKEFFTNPNAIHLKDGAVSHSVGTDEEALMKKLLINSANMYKLIKVE